MPEIVKTVKIGTLSSFPTRAFIIKILMFITTTRYNIATKKNFTKKYQKLAEIFSKNLENHGFRVYHHFNNVHVTDPRR